MDDRLLTALVKYAEEIEEARGLDILLDFSFFGSWCGCMGPQNGNPLCPCKMSRALSDNLALVLHTMGHELEARDILRRNIIKALGG